jgi:integrase
VARRDAGDGGLSFNTTHEYWQGQFVVGHKMVPDPKKPGTLKKVPIRKTVTDKNKVECRRKLKAAMAEHEAAQAKRVRTPETYLLRQCVEDWLEHEKERGVIDAQRTLRTAETQARLYIYPHFGHLPLGGMYVPDFEKILNAAAPYLAKATLVKLKSVLVRSVRHAQKASPPLIEYNFAELAEIPANCKASKPREGRALTREEIGRAIKAAEGTRYHAMIVVGIYVGLRPGELRTLTWEHVDLGAGVIYVWRSTGRGGKTKTATSKRTLRLPKAAVVALRAWEKAQRAERKAAGPLWQDNDLVFCHEDGTQYSNNHLSWRFSRIMYAAGLGSRSTYDGRHTFASILFDAGVDSNKIADQMGHANDIVTKTVYKHLIAPVLNDAADVIDAAFGGESLQRLCVPARAFDSTLLAADI